MSPLLHSMSALDTRLFFWLSRPVESRLVMRLSLVASWTGNGPLYPLLAASLFLVGSEFAGAFLAAAGIGFLIERPIYWTVKNLVKRDRPFRVLENVCKRIEPPDRFSFPSGHTAAAFLVATTLSSFDLSLAIPALLWAMSVGFSRVYLRVHFPGDVMAGAVLGISSALAGLAIAA